MKTSHLVLAVWVAVVLAGCAGRPVASERAARRDVQSVAAAYRPDGKLPVLPELKPDSPLGDYLRYAMLQQPQIEAAYFDWLASVERITQQRSLPDPRLTFEMDLNNVVQAVLLGVMAEFPGPGKLGLRAQVASAESEGKYHLFQAAILQTALSFRQACIQNRFLIERIQVTRQAQQLTVDLESVARKQNEVGKATLQDALRAQIEHDKLRTELAILQDSRGPLAAQMKAALGIKPDQPDPPLPERFEPAPAGLDSGQLLATALSTNPRLKVLDAAVRQAEASLRLAFKGKAPDFNAGLDLDLKQSPVMARPQFGMTLPIWRDKLRAGIAEAQASLQASRARLTAEQIAVAVELAEKSFVLRESERTLNALAENLLPKARLSLEAARAGYVSGKSEFLNVIEAWRALLDFEMAQVEARSRREIALAELSLAIAGVPPAGSPILPNRPTKPERNK